MVEILRQYGYGLLFLVALAENLGLPVPAFPFVLVSAALAKPLQFSLIGIVVVSGAAALIGDLVWYVLGRVRGRPILTLLCSISLNPDSCVSRTEHLFARHGLKSLLVAKFVPGLNTIAPPLAGMLSTSWPRFVAFDLAGIALWTGSALALGVIFHSQVEWLMAWLMAFGKVSALALAVLLVGWLMMKWVERRRFYRLLERSRIAAPELKERLDRGEDVVVVDLRSELGLQVDGMKIPGALYIPPREFEKRYAEIPRGRPVVMYCT